MNKLFKNLVILAWTSWSVAAFSADNIRCNASRGSTRPTTWDVTLNKNNLSSKTDILNAMGIIGSSPLTVVGSYQRTPTLTVVVSFNPRLYGTTPAAMPTIDDARERSVQAVAKLKSIPGVEIRCHPEPQPGPTTGVNN